MRRDDERIQERITGEAWDRHAVSRAIALEQLRDHRARLTLGQRADEALAAAVKVMHAPAGAIGPSGGGDPDGGYGPGSVHGALLSADSDVLRTFAVRMQLMVELVEREVDAARGLGGDRSDHMTREAKDARLQKMRGVPSHLVSVIDPTQGSPRTVERRRADLGVKPSDGT